MSTHIQKLADKLEHAKHQIKRARETGERIAVRGMHAVTTVAGGAAAGALNGMYGTAETNGVCKLAGTNIDADLALGLAGTVAGITDMAGKASDEVLAFATGLLAVATARATAQAVQNYETKQHSK